MSGALTIAGADLGSRLILGTGGFPRLETLAEAIEATGTEMVTVALRRIDPVPRHSLLDVLHGAAFCVLPNTAGCSTARDAVPDRAARARGFRTDWVKLEVIGDERTLLPDAPELLARRRAARRRRFHRPALHDRRPGLARRLEDVGCAAVMPLGSPIGSGMGIRNPYNIALIVEQAGVPVILDAGVGTASDAALAMELGCDARALRERDLARGGSRDDGPCDARRRRGRATRARAPGGSRAAPTRMRPRRWTASPTWPPPTRRAVRSPTTSWTRSRRPGRGVAAARSATCWPWTSTGRTRSASSRSTARGDRGPRGGVVGGVPDARVESSGERLGDGRFIAAPVQLTGTHAGELPGVPATGRAVLLSHAVLYCELDPPRERLWRVRVFLDGYDAAVQVGVLPKRGSLAERAMLMVRGFGLRRGAGSGEVEGGPPAASGLTRGRAAGAGAVRATAGHRGTRPGATVVRARLAHARPAGSAGAVDMPAGPPPAQPARKTQSSTCPPHGSNPGNAGVRVLQSPPITAGSPLDHRISAAAARGGPPAPRAS